MYSRVSNDNKDILIDQDLIQQQPLCFSCHEVWSIAGKSGHVYPQSWMLLLQYIDLINHLILSWITDVILFDQSYGLNMKPLSNYGRKKGLDLVLI